MQSQATMVKALTDIVSVDIGQNLVSMSIVEKQNESGLKFNERLFIVVHGVFLGYISKVKMNEHPNKINIDEAKVKVSMKNLYSVEASGEIMTIKFTTLDNGKLIPKQWIMKTASPKLANLWKQLMDYELKMRKQSPKKDTSASPPKDKNKANPIVNQPSPEKKETKQTSQFVLNVQQTKKQSSQLKRTAKVFENPLFEDSDPSEQERPKRQGRSHIKQKPKEEETSKEKPKVEERINQRPKEEEKKIVKQQQPRSPQRKSTEKIPEIKILTKSPQKSLQKVAKQSQEIKQISNIVPQRQLLMPQNLQKIEERSFEETPMERTSQLNRQVIKQYQRSPSRKVEKISQQEEKIKEKFDLGIKESQYINIVFKKLDEQNQRFPIQQLTYKHEDVQKVVKIYGRTLNQAKNQNEKTQKLLNYIIETQRQKINRYYAKGKAPEESPWIYKQIVNGQTDNLINFQTKCKQLMKILYIEAHNRNYVAFKRIDQRKNIAYLQIQDIEVKMPLIIFKKSKNNQNINLLDHSAERKIKKQFKYMKYLYRVTKNQDRIRIPFCCLCQYGGIIALFKIKCRLGENEIISKDINKIINSLQTKTKLDLQKVLKDKVKPLKQLYYNDLRQGDIDFTFKFAIISDVENLFPCDLNMNNPSHYNQLRMELVEEQFKDKKLPYCTNEDLNNSKDNSEIKVLASLGQSLNKKINNVINSLNEASFYFINPSEFSTYLHLKGINMRYLKDIYQKIGAPFLKSLIGSQMIARCVKVLFRKTLQDQCFEVKKKQGHFRLQQIENVLKERCIDIFNCIFGKGSESDAIWELISKNFEDKYQILIENREDLNKGQLLISTSYHCNINLDWKQIQINEMFNSNQFLKKEMIKELIISVQSYTPVASELKSEIQGAMKEVTYENFAFITNKLKLKSQKIPKELSFYPNFNNSIKVYLSNFVEPQQFDWANNYSHLSIYQNSDPTIYSFQTELSMIKWYLKTNKKHKYLSKFNEFSNKINKIYGANHPLLSQMYHIFSQHHKSKGEIQDSINFMKSSLLNYSALFGDHNVTVANSYYKLANLLIGYNRLYEAQEYLTKAKQTMDHLRVSKSLLDGQIRLALASLLFKDEKYKQSLELVINKVTIFQQFQTRETQNYQTERAQIYQIIYYCQLKQNAKAECARLCSHLEKKLIYFKNHNNFGEVLFIIIETYLNNLPAESKETMKKLINMIPTKMAINFYKKSYNMLINRFKQKKLFESLKKYSQNVVKIVDMIAQKNLLKVWENLSKVYERQTLFDFISLVEQLIYFLGRDRLNTI